MTVSDKDVRVQLFKLFSFEEYIGKVGFDQTFCRTSSSDDEKLANILIIYARFFFC